MITITCDQCDKKIDSLLDEHYTLLFVPGGKDAVMQIVMGNGENVPPLYFGGDFCSTCKKEFNFKKEIVA